MKTKPETYLRTAVLAETKDYCHLSKPYDFIEVTEWHNGEGFDISLSYERNIALTYGEFDLLKELVKKLEKESR